jgi:O-antigen/teichoic acid export membrane protein
MRPPIKETKDKFPAREEGIRTPANLTNRGRLGFLFKDSVLYGGVTALSKAFSLITFPLIARHYSTTDYGIIDFFGVLTAFLGVLIVFGQDSAVARLFYDHDNNAERRRLISQSLLIQLILIGIVSPLLWLSAGSLTPFLIDSPEAEYLFKIIVLQSPFLVMLNFSRNLLKWTFQRTFFLTLSLGSMASTVIMIVIGIHFLDIDVAGILIVSLINSIIFSLIGIWFVRAWLIIPRDFQYLRELIVYAFPLGIICCMGSFIPTIERWLTADLLGAQELGIYASGVKMASIIALFVGAFQTAWGPFSFSIYKQENAIHTFNTVLKSFAMTMVILTFLLAAVGYPLIILLASDRYAAGVVVIFPLAMGLVIQATSWITEIGIGISKRSHLNLYSYAAYVAFTIAGIYLFANQFGLVGVALGLLLGHVAKAATATWLSKKAFPMSWKYRVVLILLASALSYGLGVLWIMHIYGPIVGSAFFGLGFLAYIIAGPFLLFSPQERGSLWTLVKSKALIVTKRQ